MFGTEVVNICPVCKYMGFEYVGMEPYYVINRGDIQYRKAVCSNCGTEFLVSDGDPCTTITITDDMVIEEIDRR